MPMRAVACALAFASGAAGASVEPEWAGSFATPDSLYVWTAQKVSGSYADPRMKLVVMEASGSAQPDLDGLMPIGRQLLNGSACVDLPAGGTVTPSSTGVCYDLVFAQDVWQSIFRVDTSSANHVVFLAQHVPTEFEASAHYLKDQSGDDIEPVAEWNLPKPPVPWGTGIGAAILVNLMTLCGVIFLVPGMRALMRRNEGLFRAVTSSFASGALLSAAVYLLLFEATHLIAAGGEEEGAQTFKWGTMILTGFVTSMVFDAVCKAATPAELATGSSEAATSSRTADTVDTSKADVEVASVAVTVSSTDGSAVLAPLSVRVRVLSGVLLGDFMHNLCDGVFIGTAFRFCAGSLAWSVTLGTILHEIAQELSDFLVLTNPGQGGLKASTALLLNFVSGLSVLLGVLIVFSLDTVSDPAVGMLLAYGGGVYLQIGAAECMPRAHEGASSLRSLLACLAAYVVGVVAIGLVLLDHKHCAAGGHAH